MSNEWRDSLPEELRNKPLIANAPDLTHLLTNAIDMESHMGRSLTIPLPDASTDEWTQFNDKALKHSKDLITMGNKDDILTKLGKPADKADYRGDPDKEYSIDVESMKDTAFDLGLTQDQFFNLVNGTQGRVNTQAETAQATLDTGLTELYGEWGAAKASKLEAIDAMMNLFDFPEATKESLKSNKMPPEVLNAMSRMAESISGESIQGAKDKTTAASMYTPGEANELATKMENHEAFRDKMHPEHKQVQQQYLGYLDMARGNKPKERYAV